MTDNPYASPIAGQSLGSNAAKDQSEFQVASQGKRLINLIVDNIVVQVLSTATGFALGMVYAASRVAANRPVTNEEQFSFQLISFFIGLMVALGYFVIMESLFQRTVAKFLTGTVVVTEFGERPSFGQIFGRSLARFIPFEAFSFFGGQRPVGWHDKLSQTRVIERR